MLAVTGREPHQRATSGSYDDVRQDVGVAGLEALAGRRARRAASAARSPPDAVATSPTATPPSAAAPEPTRARRRPSSPSRRSPAASRRPAAASGPAPPGWLASPPAASRAIQTASRRFRGRCRRRSERSWSACVCTLVVKSIERLTGTPSAHAPCGSALARCVLGNSKRLSGSWRTSPADERLEQQRRIGRAPLGDELGDADVRGLLAAPALLQRVARKRSTSLLEPPAPSSRRLMRSRLKPSPCSSWMSSSRAMCSGPSSRYGRAASAVAAARVTGVRGCCARSCRSCAPSSSIVSSLSSFHVTYVTIDR